MSEIRTITLNYRKTTADALSKFFKKKMAEASWRQNQRDKGHRQALRFILGAVFEEFKSVTNEDQNESKKAIKLRARVNQYRSQNGNADVGVRGVSISYTCGSPKASEILEIINPNKRNPDGGALIEYYVRKKLGEFGCPPSNEDLEEFNREQQKNIASQGGAQQTNETTSDTIPDDIPTDFHSIRGLIKFAVENVKSLIEGFAALKEKISGLQAITNNDRLENRQRLDELEKRVKALENPVITSAHSPIIKQEPKKKTGWF